MSERSKAIEHHTVREASPGYSGKRRAVSAEDVPSGYKRTEVGMIPTEWELKSVRQMGDVVAGKALAAKAPGRQRPYLRTKNVFDGRIDVKDVLSMPMTDAEFARYRLIDGDVLLNEGQTIDLVGRCAIYHSQYPAPCAIQNQLIRFRGGADVSPLFAAHLFRYCQGNGTFGSIAMQTTSVAHLGVSRFAKLVLAWPPTKSEQCKIAAALSDADALIESLDRLIAKKRAIKQATMQQLLTGQTRLPGFTSEWNASSVDNKETGSTSAEDVPPGYKRTEVGVIPEDWDLRKLRDLLRAPPSYGINAAATQFDESLPSYLRITDIDDEGRFLPDPPVSVNHQSAHVYFLELGDLVFARTGASVGKSYRYNPADGKLVYAGFLIRVSPDSNRLDPRFLSNFCRTKLYWNWIKSVSLRSGQPGVNGSEYGSLLVPVPPINEQRAIATVLSDIDTEVDALERRRDKARQIKQGMMQQLLTGRVRLMNQSEEQPIEETNQSVKREANVHFKRSVLAAEIIDQLHEEPTLGHVKFAKVLFLVEHLCDVNTGSTYRREAAGPYDNRALRSIDSQLQKQQWFDARKEAGRVRYMPLAKRGGHKSYFDRYFSHIGDPFTEIIETFRKLDTERCEIVATLFAAWKDLLQEHDSVSDEMVVHEVLNNWHESKKRIAEDRWLGAIGWMRERGFVPR